MEVRTRFAPSPTGYLHVGGIRTALFAWLIARQNKGQFILRIEDTDQAREIEGSADHIQESLSWLGLTWDEGPLYQSSRLDVYKKWAEKLIAEGRAYADPYTAEEVQAFRDEAKANKQPFLYRNHRPENPPTWDGSQPLRFKSEPKKYTWDDVVMGDMQAGEEAIDDFILIKSDGFPTYNFCHIIDDFEMKISHVIRGQEFLASTPKYLNLYEALGFSTPIFATMPPIMSPEGNKKLSKRDGAKDILEYRNEGYLPEAMQNFLASLGWNDGTEEEVFTTKQLIEKFDVSRVQKSGARFDERRLLWLNGAHIRNLSQDELQKQASTFWSETALSHEETYRNKVLCIMQERLKYFAEIPELTYYFFEEPIADISLIDNNKQLKKISYQELSELLVIAKKSLENSDFTTENLTNHLNELLERTNQKPAIMFGIIRVAVSWSPSSPALADTLNVLGKEKSLKRIDSAIDYLAKN